MGTIADTEKQAIEQLAAIGAEEDKEEKSAEELVEEIAPKEEESEEEEPKEEELKESEEEDESEEEEGEEEEAQKPEEEEESEEKLAPAKMRHKLKAEREAKEVLQRQINELQLAAARQQGRDEATPKQEVETEEVPDQDLEPERYAIYKADKLEKQVQAMEKAQTRVNAERQWEDMQSSYEKSHPEYTQAKAFLIDHETAQIKSLYPAATDTQIAQHMKQQEYITAGNAAKAGVDPLQHISFLAYQAGFRPGEEKKTVKKKVNIDKIKKNAKKSASLIGGSAAAPSDAIRSADQLAKMGLEEITKMGRPAIEAAIRKIEARS